MVKDHRRRISGKGHEAFQTVFPKETLFGFTVFLTPIDPFLGFSQRSTHTGVSVGAI